MTAATPYVDHRRIIHVDMDAFYASVEQRDDPTLRGKPIAVGGSRARGVVAAASYEARRYGVRSAMASVTARRRCPELIFVRPRFDVYKAVSRQVHAIFARHTLLIQPLSLDEAYLDVTARVADGGSATAIAAAIRAAIHAETGLTASAGVSYNKFLAKLASDHRKPDGLFVITPAMGAAFVEALPVGRFHGVGPATAARMEALGIRTGADLRARPLETLRAHFGRSADYLHGIARGEDHRPVDPDRVRKSVGAENTFEHDLLAWDEVPPVFAPLIDKVWTGTLRGGHLARTVTVKVKYADFRQITRARSRPGAVASAAEFEAIGLDLLRPLFPPPLGVRLLGASLSGFDAQAKPVQRQGALPLDPDRAADGRRHADPVAEDGFDDV